MVTAVAKHLNVDPAYLQFFKAQTYREAPGPALRCTFDGTLKDILVFCRPKVPKRMFYQQLTIPIHELENKRQMKCNFWSPEQKIDAEVLLYPNKNGTVADLLVEAKNHCKLAPNGTGNLRLLEIQSHKIFSICRPDVKIETLAGTHTKSYRIEEIPADQLQVGETEKLVPVGHYQKEPYSAFGNPFLLKVKEGETFDVVKERIQSYLVRGTVGSGLGRSGSSLRAKVERTLNCL